MKLQLLDVFAKTAEDARVRTSSGGVVTLLSAVLLIWLLLLQFRAYLTFTWSHALMVDTQPQEKMVISVDMSFPNMPCDLLNIDTIDSNGEIQQDVDDQLHTQDLDSRGEPLDAEIKRAQIERRDRAISLRGPDYEGPCYGAESGMRNVLGLAAHEPVKCMTCEDVHRAYSDLNWSFDDGSGFTQCVEEGFPDQLRANKDNGCRVTGNVIVSKVKGAIHVAPGDSHFRDVSSVHSHDVSTFNLPELPYDFGHTIHRLTFGGTDGVGSAPTESDPLQGHVGIAPSKQFQFRYFLKVVGTEYWYSNGSVLQTNQYSVTHHERPLKGGRDMDHPHSIHRDGGIPGITFHYDISPMKVLETQKREQSFGTLLMNIFAIIGAVITSAAVVDKGVYAVDQALKARKDR